MDVHEHLSAQFYEWEMRGRGWRVWSEPVVVEPPFQRLSYSLPVAVDDGRRPSLLGSLFRKLRGAEPAESATADVPQPTEAEPPPAPLSRESVVELQTILPAKLELPREACEPFLSNLSNSREPIAFELLGLPGQVSVQFAAHSMDVPHVRRQLCAYFPDVVFQPAGHGLAEHWWETDGDEALVVEFGLAREFLLPLASGRIDPFIGMIGALAELQPGELAIFQVLFQPVEGAWAETMVRALSTPETGPLFVNAPELTSAAEEKASRPLFAAVVRIGVKSADYERTVQIGRDLAASLRVFAHPNGNELVPLANDDYPFDEHVEDLLQRQTRRSGMVLTCDELIGFVHLPGTAVRSARLVRQIAKTKPPPSFPATNALHLGDNTHAGRTVPIQLPQDLRLRHIHIVGATGTGKSTLLLHLMKQDLERGAGFALLDPHGDLVDSVLAFVPPSRRDDVIFFDPTDSDFPIGFNILAARSELEKTLLASDLVAVFARLSSSWGDQMASVLQNAILAFLESTEGGTLADLRRFLIEPEFRERFLRTVRDPDIVYYWRKGFTQLTGNKSIGPVITRLETFLAPKTIRYMVAQRTNRLDFADIMDSGRIFLARLSQGQIGKENAFLLGSLLVTRFQQTAMARQARSVERRRPYWLYLDEFQYFITPSMAEIVSGARKYGLGLVLAHQELRQLERDKEVASAVFSNAATRICFRVGDEDAPKLAGGFSFFDAGDLRNLDRGHAIGRIERSAADFNLAVPPPESTDPDAATEARDQIVTGSRKKYGTPRAEVEAMLFRQLGLDEPSESPESAPTSEPKRRPKSTVPEPKPTPAEPPVEPVVSGSASTPESPAGPRSQPTTEAPAADEPQSTPKPPPALPVPKPAESRPMPKSSEAPKPEPAGAPVGETDTRHQSIRREISKQAEALDFTVAAEQFVAGTLGRADLVLTRGKQVIACEISSTTNADHEAANIRKCLQGSYSHVAMIAPSNAKLTHIRELVTQSVSAEDAARVGYYRPEEFIARLQEWAVEDPAGGATERNKPRKRSIRVAGVRLTEAERQAQEAAMLKELAAVVKRPKTA